MKRWCKGIKDDEFNIMEKYRHAELAVCSFVWKFQMIRKMNSLVTVSQLNKNARANCEKCFNELKELVEVDVGSICSNGDEYDKKGKSSKDVLNYPGY